MLARVTVYWASGGSGSDAWTRKHVASSGARLRAGHCAVDPRRIPYGSKVILPDGTLTAVDTGGSVRRRTAARRAGRTTAQRNAIVVDRFFETKAQAMAWAKHNPHFMTVKVDVPGASSISTETTTTTTTTITKKTAPTKIAQARRPSLPQTVAVAAKSAVTQTATTAPASKPVVQTMKAPQPPRVATIATATPATAAVITPPPQAPALRTSVSTPRTKPTLTVATAGQAPALTVIPSAPAAPAATPSIKQAVNSAAKLAANDDTRSHYGRSVAYLP